MSEIWAGADNLQIHQSLAFKSTRSFKSESVAVAH